MSYAPEILISKDRKVLEQIRSPFTNAVCWEITGEEATTLAKHAKICDRFFKNNPEVWGRFERPVDIAIAENVLISFTQKLSPFIEEILSPIASKSEDRGPFVLYYAPVGKIVGTSTIPHVDGKAINVFYSFNDHMPSTHCIPREYEGGRCNHGGYHFSADITKAIALPGMSVSIIDIGRQIHMAPHSVPPVLGRIMHLQQYKYA